VCTSGPWLASFGRVWRALAILTAAGAQQTAKHPITFDDLIAMQRIAEGELSPDGKWVAYTAATPDLEANRNATNLWMAPVAGGDAIQLTRTEKIHRRNGRRTERRLRFCRPAAVIRRYMCCRWTVAKRIR